MFGSTGFNGSGRSNRAAALLAFGLWTAAIVPVATTTAASAASTAAFETPFALLRILVVPLILTTVGLRLSLLVPKLAVARTAVVALIAAAAAAAAMAAALTAIFALAILASFRLGRDRCGGFSAKQSFQPGHEATGFDGRFGGGNFAVVARLLSALTMERLTFTTRLARLKRFWFTRLE